MKIDIKVEKVILEFTEISLAELIAPSFSELMFTKYLYKRYLRGSFEERDIHDLKLPLVFPKERE